MAWISAVHDRYEAAMAHDPFGGSDSFRFSLHGQFVVLVTFVAASARAGVWSWLFNVAISWLTWLFFSLEDSRDYQRIPNDATAVRWQSYFEASGWESSCQRLRYEPGDWKPQAAAVARLLVYHLWQPATYLAIFYVYAPLLWRVSEFLGMISFLVLLREAVYAGFTLWTYAKYRAFMLFSLKHEAFRRNQLLYVISPDKMMLSGIGNQHCGCRQWCFYLTYLFLFALDVASGLGLAMGLTAQVLEPPIMVVWGLTAAAPVLWIAGVILSCKQARQGRQPTRPREPRQPSKTTQATKQGNQGKPGLPF